MISNMNFVERIVYILQKYGTSYLKGAGTTLLIALVSTFIGCIIGFLVGIVQTIPVDKKKDPLPKRIFLAAVNALLRIYVEVFRGTPMIVQAVFIYYGMSQIFNIQLGMWQSAFLVVSINTGAYMAESVRGGIISVDPGQMEGAKAIGMTHVQAMVNVILPQAFRNILPQIGNNLIINIKDTSVMSIIGFTEFFAVHKNVTGTTYLYFPSAAIEMAGYLTLTIVASFLLRMLEKKMDGSSSYELAEVDSLTMAAGTYKNPDKTNYFDERSREYKEDK